MDLHKKESVAVLFGGRSAEHEISIITALQAIQALDSVRYNIIPVYVASNGKWYTGLKLLEKSFYLNFSQNFESSEVQEVVLLPDPTIRGIVPIDKGVARTQDKIAIDVCLLAFHGQYGEDGCVQGLLELADLPYTGGGVLSTSLAMSKYHCKAFLKAHDIPVLPGILILREEAKISLKKVCDQIVSTPGLEKFPLFIKPCHLGSSIGISIATDYLSLHAALAKAFQYDEAAVIEPCLTELMEINIAVIDGTPPTASVVEIPVATGKALSFEDKYLRGGNKKGGQSEGMAALTRVIDPADLDPSIKQTVINYALHAFSLLRCSGVGRFDFMFDKAEGKLYFNELNSIPGSLAFYLWEKSHPPLIYTEVLEQMLQLAKNKQNNKLSIQRTIAFRALKT